MCLNPALRFTFVWYRWQRELARHLGKLETWWCPSCEWAWLKTDEMDCSRWLLSRLPFCCCCCRCCRNLVYPITNCLCVWRVWWLTQNAFARYIRRASQTGHVDQAKS